MSTTPIGPEVGARLIDATPDAVIVADRSGTVVYWNSGAERIFGFKAEEAIGQSMELIIPERLRQRHWEGFHAAVESRQSRYGPSDLLAVPALTASGETISIEFTAAMLAGVDGAVSHVGAVVRDVSARRARETEMRKKIEALEAGQAPA